MKSNSFNSYRFMLSLSTFFVLLLLCGNAFGQGQGSTAIRGSIKDPQGAVVAGASVTLTNPETNFTRSTTSNDSGQFEFGGLQPGVYQVAVEAKGFKKSLLTQVAALVSKPTDLEVAMEIGDVTETISVTVGAGEALINTQDGSLGNNFVSQQITQLPLNARNVANLLSLQPAVTPGGYVAGGRSDQANITLDGVDVNEQQTGDAFSPVLRVSPDTVEEFRVTTTNPNASQGRSSGAQVELITKHGDNEWHGNLFEYHRNTVFTANDFFNNSTIEDGKSIPRPVLLRNNFGGSLSGPMKKDRLFFFYNYEGRRDARQVTVNRTVPLPSLGQGQVRFIARAPGNNFSVVTLTTAQLNSLTTGFNNTTQTPTGLALVDINPVTRNILAQAAAKYPANNCRIGDCLNTAGFQFNASVPADLRAHVLRMDWNVTSDAKHIVYFRGNYQQDVTGGAPQFPDTLPTESWSHPWGLVANYTWTVSNNKVNNFRYGITREAFTNTGDSNVNQITFRSVFASDLFARTFRRTTPTTNITDDFSWIKGNHSLGFGTNLRMVRNNRENFTNSFDNGITNQSFYSGSGNVLSNPINANLPHLTGLPVGTVIDSSFVTPTRHAFAALIGRLSQYTANFNFNVDGTPLPVNAPVIRSFATEELDLYGQDVWKMRDNLTLTYGLRYGLSRPVYERNGFQTTPNIGLEEYLQRRFAAAEQGQNFDEPLTVNLAGPVHNKPGFYSLDKNNFQPRVAVAWSPAFKTGWLASLFGREKESTIRGGFAITNDYFGQALAVNFDGNNTLGFNPSITPSANTFNVTNRPGPLITGLGQPIRGLPFITVPSNVTFPQTQPQDGARRIEGSLDTNLVSPINYSWNFTYGRQFGKGIYVETSYIGRLARNLLATRDVMQLNNIKDPKSGQDWYTAARILEQHRVAGTPVANIPSLPFFENLYPAGEIDDIFFGQGLTNSQAAYAIMAVGLADGGRTPDCDAIGCFEFGDDWTFLQDTLDGFTSRQLFFQSQYGALSAFGTIASSDYHGATVSVRQRMRGLTWDFNYTFSKSIDDASGLQSSGVFGAAFITNALLQRDNRAVSDFDIRHIINFNSIWDIPIGRGRHFLTDSNKWVNGILGGWTLTSIARYNSALPVSSPVDLGGWPTNWNVRSWSVPLGPIQSNPTRGSNGQPANLFGDPEAAYRSFRSPAPGETGARNILRGMPFFTLDAGLYKSFQMPWNEKHKLTFRWEAFNVTNTQYLQGNADVTNGLDPQFGSPGPTFYNFTSIQGNPRIMQVALRYDF
jgi:Carboxypeptidase regulatory-like domain